MENTSQALIIALPAARISLVLFVLLALAPEIHSANSPPTAIPPESGSIAGEFGIDDPVLVRYVRWLVAMLQATGFSFSSRIDVDKLILQRVRPPCSGRLVTASGAGDRAAVGSMPRCGPIRSSTRSPTPLPLSASRCDLLTAAADPDLQRHLGWLRSSIAPIYRHRLALDLGTFQAGDHAVAGSPVQAASYTRMFAPVLDVIRLDMSHGALEGHRRRQGRAQHVVRNALIPV